MGFLNLPFSISIPMIWVVQIFHSDFHLVPHGLFFSWANLPAPCCWHLGLVGGWSYPSEKYESAFSFIQFHSVSFSQLGWRNSQLNGKKTNMVQSPPTRGYVNLCEMRPASVGAGNAPPLSWATGSPPNPWCCSLMYNHAYGLCVFKYLYTYMIFKYVYIHI